MRSSLTQTNWFGGQIAEQRHGYASDEKYFSSSALIKNLVVRPTGSLTRRPGTKFVARTESNGALGNEDHVVKLIPFVFGHESASNYVLEFGYDTSNNGYIKFYQDSAPLGGKNGSGSSTSLTADADVTHLKYDASVPWNTAEKLNDLQFVQSADIIFLVSPKVKPYKLSRSSDGGSGTWRTVKDSTTYTWTLEEFVIKDGPYLEQQEDERNGNEDVTLSITAGTPITAIADGTGLGNKKFLKPDNASALSSWENAWYDTTASGASGVPDTDINVSYLQFKSHGLLDGQRILTSAGHATNHPKTATEYRVVNATANTIKLAVDSNMVPQKFTEDNDVKLFAKYYAKDTDITIESSADFGWLVA